MAIMLCCTASINETITFEIKNWIRLLKNDKALEMQSVHRQMRTRRSLKKPKKKFFNLLLCANLTRTKVFVIRFLTYGFSFVFKTIEHSPWF